MQREPDDPDVRRNVNSAAAARFAGILAMMMVAADERRLIDNLVTVQELKPGQATIAPSAFRRRKSARPTESISPGKRWSF